MKKGEKEEEKKNFRIFSVVNCRPCHCDRFRCRFIFVVYKNYAYLAFGWKRKK